MTIEVHESIKNSYLTYEIFGRRVIDSSASKLSESQNISTAKARV
jgi:hypothetical protein